MINPFAGISLIKYIPYVVGAVFLGAVIWKVNSTFNENDALHKEIAETKISLQSYIKSDEKNKKVILAMENRIKELQKIEEERKVKVQKKAQSAKQYQEETKVGIQNTEDVDKFLMERYNGILECIEKVTRDEEDNC